MSNSSPQKTRLVSADFIRIAAMLLICITHSATGTGLYKAMDGIFDKSVSLLIISVCGICVNLFVLISGYCGGSHTHNPARVFKLWLQAVFFSILYLIWAYASGHINNLKDIIPEIQPIPLAGNYWFFTAYIGLFILSPFLNILITNLSRSQQYSLLAAIFFLFCILNNPLCSEIAATGFNLIWLSAVYVIGAILKLNPPAWKNISLFITYIFGLGGQLCFLFLSIILKDSSIPVDLLPRGYTSPFILIQSIAIFLLVVRIDMQNWRIKKIIFVLSPLMFGVYLFHSDPFVWENHLAPLIRNLFIHDSQTSWWTIPTAGLLLFTLGCLAASIQIQLFRLFRADKLVDGVVRIWQKITTLFMSTIFHS